jgi:hypothetical protein
MTRSQSEGGASRPLHKRAAPLLSKQGLVVAALAGDLLHAAAGDRIERIEAYAERFDVSVGTVQMALVYLMSSGAADLVMRGRLGSFVQTLHYPLLWSLALNRPISGALPLPYSRHFEGLATGIRLQFERQALDLDLRFMRGSAQRLQALASRTSDWALVSRFAAETAAAHGFEVDIVLLLGPESYMGQHMLLLRPGVSDLVDGMRVGVDMQSADHVYAVRAVIRGHHVELVDIDYSQGLRLLVAGAIDATVWSQENIPADLPIVTARPLNLQADPALTRLSEGAIVINRGNRAMSHILYATLDLAQLRAIEQDVVRLVRRPAY